MGTTDGSTLLVYGSYGYTGRLVVERAVEAGVECVLAGRSPEELEPQAAAHDLPSRAFTLDHPEVVRDHVADADAVLNCAGPFHRTHEPLVDACIDTGTHYLDITGEIEVFQAIAARDAEATEAGAVLLPGVGFDVVPSDCLAAHLAEALPGATHLALGFDSLGRPSAGTLKTMVQGLGEQSAVRENGRITRIPLGSRTRTVDFGEGERTATAIPWGDVSTAYRTTGIGNVEFYAAVPPTVPKWLQMTQGSAWVFTPAVKRFLESMVDTAVDGPDADEREGGRGLLWGEVTDGEATDEARLRTPNGYALTVETAVESARRVLAGEVEPGYHTPAGAFGADYVLQFDGVEREDAHPV
ncbi:saccharopine dehydrogenase family protein [Halomarina litorea]|uniref:saccharopine dehydrogenase family protein n=1 Tax=Halomarina litorea TaxID=2961595 RepID=UPI0020C1E730|nr:saccharopine dehydrogenase NADP-binding domain-containing protein [Halomarina sp. BCD28]